MIYLSIVIPAYNEGRRIGKTLSETFGYLDSLSFESEVLVVDDRSTDATVDKVSVPTTEIAKVIQPISEGRFDVVFGSRYIDGGLIGTPQSMLRRAVSRAGNVIMRRVTGLDYRDMQCGFKAFRSSTAKSVFRDQTNDGYGFDPEVLFIAAKRGWRLLE